ncbi:hypothetical protein DSO57_1021817 [Entomophthora muscae]|uniref:Uncharacterized protein n=1 Tax=Entomophthora muscae TaxID=34485 RepID=A0ACC2TE48_9FUNG|nr:hypothetical protein DSO57_1021817 [Entomophthora muscae]
MPPKPTTKAAPKASKTSKASKSKVTSHKAKKSKTTPKKQPAKAKAPLKTPTPSPEPKETIPTPCKVLPNKAQDYKLYNVKCLDLSLKDIGK